MFLPISAYCDPFIKKGVSTITSPQTMITNCSWNHDLQIFPIKLGNHHRAKEHKYVCPKLYILLESELRNRSPCKEQYQRTMQQQKYQSQTGQGKSAGLRCRLLRQALHKQGALTRRLP